MSLSTTDGHVSFDQHKTYYKVFRKMNGPVDKADAGVPLIIVHGGPTFGHNYLLPLQKLALAPGVSAVVFYDQLGCGNSSAVPEKNGDPSFWNMAVLVRQLQSLIENLKQVLGDEVPLFDVLGHSAGSLISALFAGQQPAGLRRLILSNGMASWEQFTTSCIDRLHEMPSGKGSMVIEFEEHARGLRSTCTVSQEQYAAAIEEYRLAYTLRAPPPYPVDLTASFNNWQKALDVFLTYAGGIVEAVWGGTLISESSIPVLPLIQASTLIVGAKWDKANESCSQPFFDLIPRVKWVTLDNCSHSPQFEDPERYLGIVQNFLNLP